MRSCRAVLILTALLTILMPLLEHFCKWDRFLQGGTDVEFGILAFLLFAGLILLIAHQAATSPFFSMLFSHQLTEFPLRSLLVAACPMSAGGPLLAWCGCGAPLVAARLTRTPLRI